MRLFDSLVFRSTKRLRDRFIGGKVLARGLLLATALLQVAHGVSAHIYLANVILPPLQPSKTADENIGNAVLPVKYEQLPHGVSAHQNIIIFGCVETVTLPALALDLKARVDTGAGLSSLDARNIEEFIRDGESWVSFQVKERVSGVCKKLCLPVISYVQIKRHGQKSQCRPVVSLPIALGNRQGETLFTLTDRSHFDYPVLIGRSYMEKSYPDDRTLVDVKRDHIVSKP